MTQVKLTTITRKDLNPGYQLVQTAHGVAEFAHQFPNQFDDWNRQSKYLISLSVDNEESLKETYNKLKYYGADVVAFYEPDIGNQMTAICYYGTSKLRKLTQKLDLALKN